MLLTDVGEIAAHVRRMPREILMKLPSVRGPPRDDRAEHADHGQQHRSEMPVDGPEDENTGDHRNPGRDRGPRQRASISHAALAAAVIRPARAPEIVL